MKYKVGDKVRIQPLEWYQKETEKADCYNIFDIYWCSREMTISKIEKSQYLMEEDGQEFYWTDEMIEGLVEKGTKVGTALNPIEPKSNANCLTQEMIEGLVEEPIILNGKEILLQLADIELPSGTTNIWECPEGYIFKDENGNVINATKIVLEKKKKDVDLTQEQINAMVHDSCVSFCKHCGCGVPRETCTSLGTCKEHDEYRAAIRTHLMEKKKKNEKEYPKTYEECCEVMGIPIHGGIALVGNWCMEYGYIEQHLETLRALSKLLICRDAYWKIAGDEMGLDKPWEPDWTTFESMPAIFRFRYNIVCDSIKNKHCLLVFPTEEMRDAFYENFKELIEICKELL